MKNFIHKSLIVLFLFLICSTNVYAKDIKSIYIIKNASAKDVVKELNKNLNDAILQETDNILYSNKDICYYFKVYQNNKNSEIFLYSNSEDINHTLEKLSQKAYEIDDKATFEKYNTDFETFAVSNNIGKIKTKKENKKGYENYNPYMGKLRNKVIETTEISKNNIKIERKKMKPKAKVKHYAYAYEYTIINNTDKDITIKKVASSEFIGLTQIASYCLIPRGMDFVPIYGLVYATQSDLEKNKFTRPHPENEIIKKGETMRILSLSKKQDNPIADFEFIVDDKEVLIKF